MNNRDLIKEIIVGAANFSYKVIVHTLKWLGMLLAVFIGLFIAIVAGVLKRN